MDIRYLKNNEINFVRWDNCINNSINGNIFAFSWYLDILCENWGALVAGNYDYVMPIVQKTQRNSSIIFSSKLGNRLGVFSNKLLSPTITDEFINRIPDHFSHIQMDFNKFNKSSNPNCTNKSTFELDLIQSYLAIARNYSNSFQKNIHLAVSNHISIVKGLMPNDLINFSKQRNAISNPKLKADDLNKLRQIIAHSLRYNLGELYGAYTKENNLCAAAFFLKSKRKLHLVFNVLDKKAADTYPLHYLIDKFIETHAEKTLTLNLECMLLNNDPDFFTGLGAHKYYYLQYFLSKLPWYKKFLLKTD